LNVVSTLRSTSEIPKRPDDHLDEPDTVHQGCDLVNESRGPGHLIEPDGSQKKPEADHDEGIDDGAPRQVDQDTQSQNHQGKIFRGAETEGEFGQGGREEDQQDNADRSGNEGTERGDPEGRAGPSFPGHLVSVQTGDDGCSLSGMLTRMEVVDPPYMAPYMIPARRMTAETGGT